jgi:hypothetical protein
VRLTCVLDQTRRQQLEQEVDSLALQQIELEEITAERLKLVHSTARPVWGFIIRFFSFTVFLVVQDREVVTRLAALSAIDDIKQQRQRSKVEPARDDKSFPTIDTAERLRQRKVGRTAMFSTKVWSSAA